jgi:hypothetical protein
MARNTSKTPAQIAQELQARADAAKIRAAKADSEGNPFLSQVQDMIDSTNKRIALYSRKLTGKNSFENRIRSAELRLTWIKAENALTVAENDLAKARKDYLQHSLAGMAIQVADGASMSDENVQAIVANLPEMEALGNLLTTESAAKEAWRNFVAENGGETATETQAATA